MEELVQNLINDEISNHSLNANALVEYLALKGIIDRDEFYQYRDDFAKKLIKRRYPDLPVR